MPSHLVVIIVLILGWGRVIIVNSVGGENPIGSSRNSDNLPHTSMLQKRSSTLVEPRVFQKKFVEAYEHEYFSSVEKIWIKGISPDEHRHFTSSPTNLMDATDDDTDYHLLPHPMDISSGKDNVFTSDWKIDYTGLRKDEQGWEYFIDKTLAKNAASDSITVQKRRRRRRWIRSIEPIQQSITTKKKPLSAINSNESSNNGISAKYVSSKIITKRMSKLLDSLSDDFNFKGVGWNFYKSLLVKNAGGLAFRLPITHHFDCLETRPYLPVITSTLGIFYPWWYNANLNIGLTREPIAWLVMSIVDYIRWTVLIIWWLTIRILLFEVLGKLLVLKTLKSLFLPAGKIIDTVQNQEVYSDDEIKVNDIDEDDTTKKGIIWQTFPSMPRSREIVYSHDVYDRLGFSLTWRVRKTHGFDFRISWWHLYLPTMDYMFSVVDDILDRLLMDSSEDESNKAFLQKYFSRFEQEKINKIRDWIRVKTGCLGLFWSACNPGTPRNACNILVTFSGFYYTGSFLRKIYCRISKNIIPSKRKQGKGFRIKGNDRSQNESSISKASYSHQVGKPKYGHKIEPEEEKALRQ